MKVYRMALSSIFDTESGAVFHDSDPICIDVGICYDKITGPGFAFGPPVRTFINNIHSEPGAVRHI